MKLIKYIVSGILFLFAFIWTGAFIYASSLNLSTNVANDLAMKQMENTELSSYHIQTYSMMVNVVNTSPIIMAIIWVVAILFLVWVIKSSKNVKTNVDSE